MATAEVPDDKSGYRWINESGCFLDKQHYENNSRGDIVFSEASTYAAGIFAALFAASGFTMNLVTVVALLTSRKTRYQITTPFIVRDYTFNYQNKKLQLATETQRAQNN